MANDVTADIIKDIASQLRTEELRREEAKKTLAEAIITTNNISQKLDDILKNYLKEYECIVCDNVVFACLGSGERKTVVTLTIKKE